MGQTSYLSLILVMNPDFGQSLHPHRYHFNRNLFHLFHSY